MSLFRKTACSIAVVGALAATGLSASPVAGAEPPTKDGCTPQEGVKLPAECEADDPTPTPTPESEAPSTSVSTPDSKPTAKPTPKPTPKPTKPGSTDKPEGDTEVDEDAKPEKDKKPTKAELEREKERRKKEKEEAERKARAEAARLAALAAAEDTLARSQRKLPNAKRQLKTLEAKLADIDSQITALKAAAPAPTHAKDEAEIIATMEANNPLLGQGHVPDPLGTSSDPEIQALQDQRATTAALVKTAQSTLDMLNLDIAVASRTLDLESHMTVEEATRAYLAHADGAHKCAVQVTNGKNTCEQAIEFAYQEAASPSKSWSNLCLNFVTIAYGAPQSIPRAIDHWTGLPDGARHSPDTIAPAGALMFWSPNHVALSIGDNKLISNDVLGDGRIWVTDMATIQARWNMPYLGWSQPDFSAA